jgi:thioredoxin reductase
MHDVIIIGGSYAGIAAALQLARARRRVLVLDAGQRRNRFASTSHGFLGQDGQAPEAIAAKGRAEVLAYPTVTWLEASVTAAHVVPAGLVAPPSPPDAGGFSVRAGEVEHRSRRIILATGVIDVLPEVPGLAERWGRTVFHCPYCHGYELDQGRVGILATSALSTHQAVLASQWAGPGQATLFLNGAFEPDAEQLADLASREIQVERELVVRAEGDAPAVTLALRDGRTVQLDGLFVIPRTVIEPTLARQLGCELEEGFVGSFYKTDAMKETTVPGVFACGDVALPMGSVSFAVADGARAGIAAHQSLVFRPAAP